MTSQRRSVAVAGRSLLTSQSRGRTSKTVPRKHTYAQHFLRRTHFVSRLIGKSTIAANDLVLDIGAGSGIISSQLAKHACNVWAIESEPQVANKLRANMHALPNVHVIAKDFMHVRLPQEPYKVFANIPFHLSAQILERLLLAKNQPDAIYLIVQKQFARKLLPSSNFTSALGVFANAFYRVRIVQDLRQDDFAPPPAVDTVLLELRARAHAYINPTSGEDYLAVLRACFHDPKQFAKLYRGELKPSQLHPSDWADLYKNY